MAGKKNAFYSTSFLIFIIRFFPTLANLGVMIYYSKHLPKETYGSYNNFWVQLNVFYPLLCLGMQALIMTYSAELLTSLIRNIKTKHYLLYMGWVTLLGSAFAVLQWNKIGLPFAVSFLFILGFAFTFIFESLLIVFKDFRLLVIVNVLYSVAYWLIHYSILKGTFSINYLFLGLLAVTFSRAAIYFLYTFIKLKKLPHSSVPPTDDMAKIKNLWFHLGLYDVVQSLSMWVDKFIVSILLTSGVSAIYFNGSMNIPFLPLVLSAAGSAVLIQLAAGDKNDEITATLVLLNKTGKLLSSIVFPVFFFLLFFNREIFVGFLFGAKYEPALPVFIASLLILPVRAYNFTSILQRLHLGAVINKGAIGEILLAIAIAYPLYLLLGLPGLALSFVISTYLQAAYYLVATAKALQVTVLSLIPMRNWLIKFVIAGCIFASLYQLITIIANGNSVLFYGIAVLIVTMGALLLYEIRTKKSA